MWGGVETRKHKPELVVSSEDGKVFMLNGTVRFSPSLSFVVLTF
jgi:hypothetical protein